MKEYKFVLILKNELTLEQESNLYGEFNDAILLGVASGVPYIDCEIRAASLESAIIRVADRARAEGVVIARIEMDGNEINHLAPAA